MEMLSQILKYLNIRELKATSLVCKRLCDPCQSILFWFPKFKRKAPSKMIKELPIKVMPLSQMRDFIPPFFSIQTFILDNKMIPINPDFIKRNPEIRFLISIDYIYPSRHRHFSNFLFGNVWLFKGMYLRDT